MGFFINIFSLVGGWLALVATPNLYAQTNKKEPIDFYYLEFESSSLNGQQPKCLDQSNNSPQAVLCSDQALYNLCEAQPKELVNKHKNFLDHKEARQQKLIKVLNEVTLSQKKLESTMIERCLDQPDMRQCCEEYYENEVKEKADLVFAAKLNKVQTKINKFVESYSSIIDQSKYFKPAQKTYYKKLLSECSKNISIDYSEEFNARIPYAYSNLIDGVKKQPTLNHQVVGCGINLSFGMLDECDHDNEACNIILMHELGHLFNTSIFHDLQFTLAQNKELGFNPKTDQFKPTEKSAHLGEDAQYLFQELNNYAEASQNSSYCLNYISSPKKAIPNACVNKEIAAREFGRSTMFLEGNDEQANHARYPNQWEEAEADFWAASGYAQYLKQAYPNAELRKKQATEGIYFLMLYFDYVCPKQNWFLKPNQKAAEKLSKSWDKLFMNGCGSVSHPKVTKSPNFSCAREVHPLFQKNSELIPAWQSHQDTETRINKNMLLNSDMREALGCNKPPYQAVTCSPISGVKAPVLGPK